MRKVGNNKSAQEYYDELINAIVKVGKENRWNYMVYKKIFDVVDKVFDAKEDNGINMKKELHIYMDGNSFEKYGIVTDIIPTHETYVEADKAARGESPVVRTTQVACCSFDYGRRVFIHYKGETHEITIGKCEGTDKEIRKSHNIMRMLLTGAFDWYQG